MWPTPRRCPPAARCGGRRHVAAGVGGPSASRSASRSASGSASAPSSLSSVWSPECLPATSAASSSSSPAIKPLSPWAKRLARQALKACRWPTALPGSSTRATDGMCRPRLRRQPTSTQASGRVSWWASAGHQAASGWPQPCRFSKRSAPGGRWQPSTASARASGARLACRCTAGQPSVSALRSAASSASGSTLRTRRWRWRQAARASVVARAFNCAAADSASSTAVAGSLSSSQSSGCSGPVAAVESRGRFMVSGLRVVLQPGDDVVAAAVHPAA